MRILAPSLLLALAACAPEPQAWEGYALRDRPGADGTRLVGGYNDAASCRAALLASDSDPSSEALVCTRGCPEPRDGELEGCTETQVVRPAAWKVEATDPLNVSAPEPAPANAADRSPDSGPSRP